MDDATEEPDKQDRFVAYYDGPHIYLHKQTGRRLVSVTQWVSRYFSKFDAAGQSRKQADRYGGWPNFWQYVWERHRDLAASRGTKDHLHKENLALQGLIEPPEDHLWDMPIRESRDVEWPMADGLWPEALVGVPSAGVYGQADALWLSGGCSWADDYKTCKTVDKKGFGGRRAKPPFSFLPDSNYGKYVLQLNLLLALVREVHGHRPQRARVRLIGKGRKERMEEAPLFTDKVLKELQNTEREWKKG